VANAAAASLSRLDCVGEQMRPNPTPGLAMSAISGAIGALTAMSQIRQARAIDPKAHIAIIVGQIIHAYVDDRYMRDAERGVIDTSELSLFGAVHGARWYARLSDRFAMDRPTWAEWRRHGKAG
jgi:hypothetical protein